MFGEFDIRINKTSKPITFCILDGWGISKNNFKNAVKNAYTPNFDYLNNNYPSTQILASGEDVGLPKGQVGNSEVGHMNIGCGRVLKQNLLRIDESINSGSLKKHNLINNFVNNVSLGNGTTHILGLVSSGGVHSKDNHILELANILVRKNIKVIIHAFTDGRDVLPNSALSSLVKFNSKLPKGASIGSVMGRFFSMDRDNRWDRTLIAWKTLVLGEANYYSTNVKGLIQDAYNRGETDEFISPTIIKKNEENYFKGINNGDGLIIANFRSDRVRQIINSLTDKNFNNFVRSKTIDYSSLLGMVPYSYEIDKLMPSLFPKNNIKNSLGEILSNSGLKQLRIAETEKYPHVTFFFNGGDEKVFNGEERVLISSPDVETYDLRPKMSASEITDEIIKSINNKNFDIIIANFANPDMVGHSGNYESTLQAVEYVDDCVGKIFKAVNEKNGILILTSDHGNSETMWDEDQKSKHTAHTNNLVPFILVNGGDHIKLNKGKLSDIAPTIIELLNIDKPKEIEGNSLII